MGLRRGILLICVCSVINHLSAAPAESGLSTSDALSYSVGKSYKYSFTSRSSTELSGDPDEQTRVEVKGEAWLSKLNGNDFVLTLRRVELRVPSLVPSTVLEGSSVQFSYVNGRITNFRVTEGDPLWSTNLKRGVASLFVNYAIEQPEVPRAQYYEDDISGSDCPTSYVVSGDLFKKTRDLNECKGRDGGFLKSFGIGSGKSSRTLTSTQTCTQRFTDGILQSSTCTETHDSQVFFVGAGAKVSSSLTFESVEAGRAAPISSSQPSCITFKHAESGVAQADATDLVTKLCTDPSGETFLQLKTRLKYVTNVDSLYAKALQCGKPAGTKLFLQALASAGSTKSIAFMAKLIKDGKVKDRSTLKLFRIYTAFASKPEEEALQSMKSLIEDDQVDPKFYLTASALAHQFCAGNCGQNAAYASIAEVIARKAEQSCRSSAAGIHALQALGNMENLPTKAVNSIKSCLSGKNRIHALQAFRRDACVLKEEAKEILRNPQNPTDERIAAYVAYVNCDEDTEGLKAILKNEESLQVLAYIKSHHPHPEAFTESVNPLYAKELKDWRKYSQHGHFSVDGQLVESNLIYSPESYLPKAASFNYTANLHGKEYNFAEVGFNFGNYDSIFETLFEPESTSRRRRDVNSEISALKNQVQIRTRVPNPNTDMFLRIFGTTIFASSVDINELLQSTTSTNFGTLIVNAVKDMDVDLLEGIPLYSNELIVPSISGLPLTLNTQTSAVMSLQLSKRLSEDVTKFSPRFAPKASLKSAIKFTFGSEIFETGYEVDTNFKAGVDLSGDGLLQALENGYSYELGVKLKDAAFGMTNGIFRIQNTLTKETKEEVSQQTKVNSGCAETVKKIFGLNICYKCEGPEAEKRSLFLKRNVQITVDDYQFKVVGVYQKPASGPTEFRFSFDTPGSTENRKVEVTGSYEIDPARPHFQLNLDSPVTKSSFSYIKTVSPTLDVTRKAKVTIDGKEWGVGVAQRDQDRTSELTVSVITPNSEDQVFKSSFDTETGSFSVTLSSPNDKQPIVSSSGTLNIRSKQLTDFKINYRRLQLILLSAKLSSSHVTVDAKLMDAEYDFLVDLDLNWGEETRSFSGTLKSNKFSFINTQVTYDGIKRSGYRKGSLTLVGTELKLTLNSLKDNDKVSADYDFKFKDYESKLGFSCSTVQRTYTITLTGKSARRSLSFSSSRTKGSTEAYRHSFTLTPGPSFEMGTDVKFADGWWTRSTTLQTSMLPEKITTQLSYDGTSKIPRIITSGRGGLNFKLSKGQTEFLSISIQHGDDLSVNLFTRKGGFKLSSDKKTKIDLSGQVSVGNQIEFKANVLKVDRSLQFEFDLTNDNDPNKAINIKSDNKYSQGSFRSKNTANLAGKPSGLDIIADLENSQSSKYITLTFDILAAGDKAKVSAEGGVKRLNVERKEFQLVAKYAADYADSFVQDGKTYPRLEIVVDSTVKPDGGRRVSGEVSGGGLIYKTPVNHKVGVDIGGNAYAVEYRSGSRLVKVNLSKKQATLKTITLTVLADKNGSEEDPYYKLTGELGYRYGSIKDFEWNERVELKYRGSPTSAVRKVSVSSGSFSYFSEINLTPDQAAHRIKVNFSKDPRKVTAQIEIHDKGLGKLLKNPDMSNAEMDFQLDRDGKNFDLIWSGKFPNQKAFSVKASHVVSGDVRKSSFDGKLDDLSIVLQSNIENGDTRKSAEVTLQINEDPVKKIRVVYTEGDKGPAVEAFASWNDQEVTSKGGFEKFDGGYDLKFHFDSPTLAHKWALTVSQRVDKFSVSAESTATQEIVSFSYDLKKSPSKLQFSGKAKVKLALKSRKLNVLGGLKVQYEKERRALVNLQFGLDKNKGNVTLEVLKTGDKDKSFTLEGCYPIENCVSAVGELKTEVRSQVFSLGVTRGDSGAEVRVEIVKDGEKESKSIKVTRRLNGVPEEVGARLYKENGRALEIVAPSTASGITSCGLVVDVLGRSLEASVTKYNLDDSDGWGYEGTASLEPTKKLTFALTKSGSSVNEQGQGADIILTLRHHLIPRDMRGRVNYRYGNGNTLKVNSELDLFKTETDKLVVTLDFNGEQSEEEEKYRILVKAEGQGLEFGLDCKDVKIEEPQFTCSYNKKVNGNKKQVDVKYHRKRMLEISSQGETRFAYSRTGSTLDLTLQRSTLSIKPTSSGISFKSSDGLTEFWSSKTGEKAYGFGVLSGKGDTRNTLVDVQLNLKGPIGIKLDWNKNYIGEFLDRTTAKATILKQSVKELLLKSIDSFDESRLGICNSLGESAHDFTPILDYYESYINGLIARVGYTKKVSLKANAVRTAAGPSTALKDTISKLFSQNLIEKFVEAEKSMLDSISQLPPIPDAEKIKERVASVRLAVIGTSRYVRAHLTQLEAKYPILTKVEAKVSESLSEWLEESAQDIQALYPYPEVKEFRAAAVKYLALDRAPTQDDKNQVLDKMDKAVEVVLSNALSANFQNGHLEAYLPIISQPTITVSEDSGLTDFIERLILNPRSALPPVDATAFLFGSKHYVTFDGKSGQFSRSCNYLLASDFSTRNFTVTTDFNSVTVTDGDERNRVVLSGGRANVNGGGAFTVTQRNGWSIVSGPGVKVGCIDQSWGENDHICAVQISGYYHGKVRGAFGKFDNELIDELTLPNGKVTQSNEKFLSDWGVACSGRARSGPLNIKYKNLAEYDTFFTSSFKSPHRQYSSPQYNSSGRTGVLIFPIIGLVTAVVVVGYFGF